MKVLLKEPQLPNRAPRRSSPAPVRRRSSATVSSREEILELQRTAGNQAAVRAIQRALLTKRRPGAEKPVRPVPDPGTLPNPRLGWWFDKEGSYRVGQGVSPAGAELSTGIGSAVGEAGKLHGVTAATEAGGSLDSAGYAAGGAADLLTIAGKGGELHGNRVDAAYAKDSGSAFWDRAARRQVRIKGADVGLAAAKLVTSDTAKSADYGVSAAEAAGHVASHAAVVTGVTADAVALPIQVISVLRDLRKLLKQGARLRRMTKRLYGREAVARIDQARRRKDEAGQALLAAGHAVAQVRAKLPYLESALARHEAIRRQFPSHERVLSQAREELARTQRALADSETAVREAREEKQKADEAYQPMADAVREMAAEVRALDAGKTPSLKTLAYYARVKSAKGVTRRTVKVIAGSLGVAGGIVSLIALASGPGAVALAPIGVILAATGAALGLGLAAQTGWRYLSKRWRMTEDGFLDTGKTVTDQTGEINQQTGEAETTARPVYKKIEGRFARLRATFSFRGKLYDDPARGQDGRAKERKSHRKLMAEALWDYATNDKHPAQVRQEAWSVIKDLTGRTSDEIVGPDSGTAPNTLVKAKVLEGQKAAALKLFEDKLKSA